MMSRSDYILYIVGVAFFIVACYALLYRTSIEESMGGMLIYSAVVFVLFLFGVTALIFGYNLRPKKQTIPSITPPAKVDTLMELTQVKGIGEKRAEQLKALGILSVADLAAASAETLAEKLQVSQKITSQWVMNARNLLLEK